MRRDAILLLGRKPNPQVKLERTGDYRGGKLADGFSRDASNDLAGQVAEGQRVIGVRRARLPPWLHVRQRRRATIPIEQLAPEADSAFLVEAHQARSMRQDVANCDRRLALGRKLRPIARDGRV